jgi:hypothetical protein
MVLAGFHGPAGALKCVFTLSLARAAELFGMWKRIGIQAEEVNVLRGRHKK